MPLGLIYQISTKRPNLTMFVIALYITEERPLFGVKVLLTKDEKRIL